MILEIEKRKLARSLEQSKKALADAMWRKKKEKAAANQEAGLTLATSAISEQPIYQADDDSVAGDLFVWKYRCRVGWSGFEILFCFYQVRIV